MVSQIETSAVVVIGFLRGWTRPYWTIARAVATQARLFFERSQLDQKKPKGKAKSALAELLLTTAAGGFPCHLRPDSRFEIMDSSRSYT
jgi:hypothetical protein